MRLDGLEKMHLRHIKVQKDHLADFEVDLRIHHGQKTGFATLYHEESFRPEWLDHLYTALHRGKIPFILSHL